MSKKKRFKEVNPREDFPAMEKELLDKWYEDGIVDKYLHKNDKSEKYFSFQDGPITANNPMGVHHAWGRTYKDLWQRYKNMQGYKQRFQNGFDSQGLWVEVEVEKDLGFRSKKDIEGYGVAKFVQKCKDRVVKYSEIQTQQSKRLGYFMDWDNSYYTMSDENNYMIWHFIKVCHDHGWLYKGNGSVPWCPRCETAISQHEILTEDYAEVTHKSIFFDLPIVGKRDEYLLVWTTTPWTLPANIAVAVDKKMEYSQVVGETGDKYWLATGAVERIFGGDTKTEKRVKGEKLVGLRYKWAFDDLPAVAEVAKNNKDNFHTVVVTDDRIMPISSEEGTGMVHTAVSAGTEDFKLGKKLGLPMIPVIDDAANYIEGLGFLTGKNAKKNPRVILDYLTEEDKKDGVNWVFDIQNYKHRYPRCWRCKAELVWKVTDEWYIAMDRTSSKTLHGKFDSKSSKDNLTLRERMVSVTKTIEWIPEFGLKRELDWLENMHDWMISKKNRYWGLCLPIWECDECEYFEVIDGKEDLKEKAISGWDNFEGKSPHKPYLDEVKIKCPKCAGEMTRIEPVGNPWLDAGIVMYSTVSADNSDNLLYNSDRSEWRKWFPADFITESFPGQFKNWFYSMIAMSTVLENERPYKAVLGFATLLDEKGQGMHKSLGNSIEFNEGADKIGVDVMRWMYARQNPTDNLLFGYKYGDEIRRQFHLKLWNVYNLFVLYANRAEWVPKQTLKSTNLLDVWILARLNITILGVTKFLDKYDVYRATILVEDFVNELSNWYVRRSRDRTGAFAVSKEDAEFFFSTLHVVLIEFCKLIAPFMPFISDKIYTNLTGEESVHLADWPKSVKPSKEALSLINEMEVVREIVELGHSIRKEKGLPVRQPLSLIHATRRGEIADYSLDYLILEELNVKQINVDYEPKHNGDVEVRLDTKITPELEEEAKTRDLAREIQKARKELGAMMDDEVIVFSPWLPEKKDLVEFLKKKTMAKSLKIGNFDVKKT